jgi:ABC-type transport system substrate-binding protein
MLHNRALRTTLILPLLALLVGCTSLAMPGSPTPSPSATATVELPTAVAPPDTLRWSLEGIGDLQSLDPARPGGLAEVTVIGMVFSGLVRLDGQMDVVPDGASDWTVSADGRVYTFEIREGLAFGDGTPVSADDWVFSINRALAPETASYGAPAQLSHIVGAADVASGAAKAARGVRAVDARHLEITLDAPLAYFLAQLVYPYTYVVPRALVEGGGEWASSAYGTGPYRVVKLNHGHSIELVANSHYWPGTPGVPKLLMPFNPDSDAAYLQYRAGQLDVMGSWQTPIPAARVAEAHGLPGFASAAILATRYIGFNNQKAPFDQLLVRRAFALATDKAGLVERALHGTDIPADRLLPTGLLGTQLSIQPLAFDADAARSALAEAGHPNGQGLPPITLTYAREGDNAVVAQTLQAMWQQNLGVAVQLEELDLDAFSGRLDETYRTPENGLQMYYSIWGADYPDPQNFLSQQLTTGTANNNGHFSDAQFDQLVAEADQLGDRSQIERRLQLYVQAEQIAIDKVGWLPLFYPRFNILLNPRVEGLVITPNGLVAPDWTRVRLRS